MRVLTCLANDHDWRVVLLAALMCIAGSFVSTTLFQRAMAQTGASRLHWCFLAAVTAGSATWTTHFIAMLGYRANVPVTFDGPLTVGSALIAVGGIGIGLLISTVRSRSLASIVGGGTIGLSISAMHYVGMFAYRVDGIVSWLPDYVVASIVVAVVLSALVIDNLRRLPNQPLIGASVMLSLAIVGLHFTGMAAFSVTPIPGVAAGADTEAFTAMAAAIVMVALMIVGTGISTHLMERRINLSSQNRLAHIAMHDALTELANRHAFSEALESECVKQQRYGRPFALLTLDLDRFKPINDTLGHPIGDVVLQMVSTRLRCAVRHGDLVARIGGDEFAIITYGISEISQATQVAHRVVEVLSRPFVVNGNVAELGGSVGVAVAPEHGTTAEQLVQHADIALYTAKRAGRERFCVFDPQMMDTILRRRYLEADLRRACMREDFEVVYQPVSSSLTGEVIGAEALLRWTCPGRGEIPPSEFIPLAEELGLISRIGATVLLQACRDAATWPDDLDIAVNISPVQLLDPRLPQAVSQALEESGLRPSRLELEITETALVGNDEAALRTLTKLRELGVQISLDDFGTGYSSLSYLHRFPIGRIKIDRSFVQQLPDDRGSASIVRAIAQLGKSLDMKITAEGIETAEQLSFIAEHGCDHVQGFLISRPLKADVMFEMLRARADAAAA